MHVTLATARYSPFLFRYVSIGLAIWHIKIGRMLANHWIRMSSSDTTEAVCRHNMHGASGDVEQTRLRAISQVDTRLDSGPIPECWASSDFRNLVGLRSGLQIGWAATELWNLLTERPFWFWLSLWPSTSISSMDAKSYKFGMFCQQCHPNVAPDDADIRPRNASRIHTCHLFTRLFMSHAVLSIYKCTCIHFGELGSHFHRSKIPKYCSG